MNGQSCDQFVIHKRGGMYERRLDLELLRIDGDGELWLETSDEFLILCIMDIIFQ